MPGGTQKNVGAKLFSVSRPSSPSFFFFRGLPTHHNEEMGTTISFNPQSQLYYEHCCTALIDETQLVQKQGRERRTYGNTKRKNSTAG